LEAAATDDRAQPFDYTVYIIAAVSIGIAAGIGGICYAVKKRKRKQHEKA